MQLHAYLCIHVSMCMYTRTQASVSLCMHITRAEPNTLIEYASDLVLL